jgi:nucleoside-diphosphate-sugar epimerase
MRGWLHVSDAVRAIEAAAHVKEYSVINIGHPEILSIADLAEIIRRELQAAPSLITYRELPSRMTLIKRPTLERQKSILGVVPKISPAEGVKLVCSRVRQRIAVGEQA